MNMDTLNEFLQSASIDKEAFSRYVKDDSKLDLSALTAEQLQKYIVDFTSQKAEVILPVHQEEPTYVKTQKIYPFKELAGVDITISVIEYAI
jgi:hypothetical protein